jgi:2-polyprenyl-3-methyl-5-hydroxy-6-metoxy-1,4-benzoquinol methylase
MPLAANSSADDFPAIAVEAIVSALYQSMLLRAPEEGAIPYWGNRIANGERLDAIVTEFLNSAEFRSHAPRFVDLYRNDRATHQYIEAEIDQDSLKLLWAHVEKTWSQLGSEEPYFSVLTDPRFKSDALSGAADIDAFYATGQSDVERVDSWLARNGLSLPSEGMCVEYGCGVGRCTEWLARRFRRVVAMDVSASHLALAVKRATETGVRNAEYVAVKSRADLANLGGVDFFYSVIVLQHSPPPIIFQILDAAFGGLNNGGIAYFQVPTRGPDGYSFRLKDYLGGLSNAWMEMHALDQGAVFRLAHRHGLRPVEASPDHCTGGVGVSTTFLMQKDV